MNRDGSDPVQVTKESFRLRQQPRMDAGQPVRRRPRKHFTSRRSGSEPARVWLYHRTGGEGFHDDQAPERSEGSRRAGVLARRPLPLLQPGHHARNRVRVQQGSQQPDLRHPAARSGDGTTSLRSSRGPGGSIRPTPSPDGKKARVRPARSGQVGPQRDPTSKSGAIKPIYDGLDRDMQETWAIHGVYPRMAWTPDNKSIVFWAGGATSSRRRGDAGR
jgi:hypothetical protein